MQYLYAVEISGFEDTKVHYKNLIGGIHSVHKLFILQTSLMLEILKKAKNKYEISLTGISGNISQKYSNSKFSNNKFLNQISSSQKIIELVSLEDFINWDIDYKFINLIYDLIIKSDIYSEYLKEKTDSYEIDSKFVYDFYKDIIVPNEKFQSLIEEKNIFWMDDFALVNSFVLKFIKKLTPKNLNSLFYFELFSNLSDKKYSEDLANLSLNNFKSNNDLINNYLTNWDLDRIAKIDLVIINLAITEIKEFKNIPVKVSLNEYIEISKEYSTEKSSFFINGILDKIVKDLIEKDSIIKQGRGLRE